MTDFNLTSGNDTFAGSAGDDNFYGWTTNPSGGGVTGGADSLTGGDGNDHFYLEAPGQSGTIEGGNDTDTVHVRATLGNVAFTLVEIAEFAADGTRFSGTADQFNAFGTLKIAGATSGVLKLTLTQAGAVDFGSKLKGTESVDIDATGIVGGTYDGTDQGDVFHISGSSGSHQFNGGDGDDTYIYTGEVVSGFYPSQNAGAGVDTLIATDFDFTNGGFLNLEQVYVDGMIVTVAKLNEFTKIANSSGGDSGTTAITLGDFSRGGTIDLSTKAIAGHRISLDARLINTDYGGVDATLAAQADTFFGSGEADTVHAGDGADTLHVGSAAEGDQVFGEGGDDTFIIADFSAAGGTTSIDGGSGTDTLEAYGTITDLNYASIERLLVDSYVQASIAQLQAFASIGVVDGQTDPLSFELDGSGGTLDFTALPDLDANGNGVVVSSYMLTSAINLIGTTDADSLAGTDFADTLAGGAGGDSLAGGSGDDTYVLGSEATGVDEVNESTSGGTDTITSAISRSLTGFANVENLTLTGTAAKGTGDARDNLITGNDVANTLKGGDGDDTLVGGGGADRLDGGRGTDFVSYLTAGKGVGVNLADPTKGTSSAKGETFKSIEGIIGSTHNDRFVGNAKANWFEGGAGADKFNGGLGSDIASYRHATKRVVVNLDDIGKNKGDAAGDTYKSIERIDGSEFGDKFHGDAKANILAGYHGHDTMTGGGGSDRFVFENIGAEHSDTVTDFVSGADKIALKGKIFDEMAVVTADNLVVAKGHKAHDANDHVLFDTKTHTLWYDFDGDGVRSAELIATFKGVTALSAGDFIII